MDNFSLEDNIESQYIRLLASCLNSGEETDDRTGVGTFSKFGAQLRADMRDGFPLLTTKRVYWKGVVGELLWFLRGDTNVKWLQENGIHIWDEWADENGNLGPVYGAQWRSWKGQQAIGTRGYRIYDQIQDAIDLIKNNPESRRIIVSAWNVSDLNQMALPPCHLLFQFNVRGDYLDLQLYQRSADMFLGVPFNIASYSLLLHMVAQVTGKIPGEFVHTFGDYHIYKNHVSQVMEQLERTPKNLPELKIVGKHASIDDFTFDSFELIDYNPHGTIKAPVAV